jgi:hypothetical protein
VPDDPRPGAAVHAMADLVTPMALRVAATLRLADHIASGRHTAAELAAASGAHALSVDRLLRHLATRGVVTVDGAGRFELTALGAALRDDHPSRVRRLLDPEGALGRADLSFVHLLHSVRSGDAAFPEQFGRPFWADLATDPGRSASYDELMGADVTAWAPAISAACDWAAFDHVMDVGGGDGSLLAALLRDHPDLRGTVFDQPATAAAARRRFAEAHLSERADAIGGSFFDPLPAGADAYLLTAIIHDWDDDAARVILRRCADAAGTKARVFVIEKIGTDGASPNTEMDLRLLAYFGGRERSPDDVIALAEASELHLVDVHRAAAISVIELRPR